MRIKDVLVSLRRNVANIPGWRTNRKLIVIESDDWGSIRMPSKKVYDDFIAKGMPVQTAQYNKYDSLESNDDLNALFEVLISHKDKNNNPACITANMILANPDFAAIEKSNFSEYHYEKVQHTLGRYPSHDKVVSLYKQGLNSGVFRPQFHGREHVQINRWLKALHTADEKMRYAFSCGTTYSGKKDYNFMESFDWDSREEIEGQKVILDDGLSLFQEFFGYSSQSFIPPCYTLDPALESSLVELGIRYMQGVRTQYIPQGGFDNYLLKKHTLGDQQNGLIRLTRNCFFEPSLVEKADWVDYTLAGIADAFRWKKPAIICAHRINFIGYIDEANRTRNLMMFDQLLTRIRLQWPEVEFLSSDQLGEMIALESNNDKKFK